MRDRPPIDAETRARFEREERDAECLQDFIFLARERGYKSAWAFKKWREMGAPTRTMVD